MTHDESDLARLELLSDVDTLTAELAAWQASAPPTEASVSAVALVRRLLQRADTLRLRFDAPLVVATLGGTGTGKSTLINALLGQQVSAASRQRPTTMQPLVLAHPSVTPEQLGLLAADVRYQPCDSPLLRDLVLIDCPDADTTETESAGPAAADVPMADVPLGAATNLARLRRILPHCDVLLIVTTQQKYRSARLGEELAAAAPGTRLVFVQTHADRDTDIRDDWREHLSDYEGGEMFFVDSLSALRDAHSGLAPRGEMRRLVELLTRELSTSAAKRIRRVSFLDLVGQTLGRVATRLDAHREPFEKLQTAIHDQRGRLATQLADQFQQELLSSRGAWENRLLAEVVLRWGFSPFACLLRAYQGLGAMLSGAALWRVRNSAQLALWGAGEAVRQVRKVVVERNASVGVERTLRHAWSEAELRRSVGILAGYAAEAGLKEPLLAPQRARQQAAEAAELLVVRAGDELQTLVAKLAKRHTQALTRWRYELLLLIPLGLLLYRLGKNFFWDSWLAVELGYRAVPEALLGSSFFLAAAILLGLWCGGLLWMFTGRLRRGLTGEVAALAEQWRQPCMVEPLFAETEQVCRQWDAWCDELQRLRTRTAAIESSLAEPLPALGRSRATAASAAH